MGNWKLVVPVETQNLLIDTSFFQADPDTEWTFAGDGAEDWTRGTTYQFFGVSAAVANLGGGTWADVRQTVTTTATDYTISCYVRRLAGGVPTASHTRAYFDDAVQDWDSLTAVGGGWYYCVYTATATAAANEFGVRVLEASASVDGVQLENKAYETTYCDGTRDGCEWNGAEHDSTSTRSAVSRAGGRLQDFADDYTFYVTGWTGWGVAPVSLGVDSYALLPGGQLNSVKVHDREFALVGTFTGTSQSNLHALRQALSEELAHDRYPKTGAGWQPVTIRYEGATVHKEIAAHYSGGLEGGIRHGFSENCAIRMQADNPYWYEIGESAAVLDHNDSATLRYLAGRLKSTGQWDDLGLTADPTVQGAIHAVCRASDGSVYFGGIFDGINNNVPVGGDYIIRFDPSDQSWNLLVGASDINGAVYDIVEGPDGTIYLCGNFTAVNGVGTSDYIVSYDPVADTWASLGDPDSGGAAIVSMHAIAFDSSGDLYVVGDFTNLEGVAAADFVGKWDGAAWAAVGAPSVGAGLVYDIALDSQDNIYVVGNFTNFAGDADADFMAWWNGTAWDNLATSIGGTYVTSLAITDADVIYFAGDATDVDGVTDADYAFKYNGQAFEGLASGLNAAAYEVQIAPDGVVYFCGAFTGTGDGTLSAYRFIGWNGSSWFHTDASFTGGTRAFDFGVQDATIPTNYSIFVGGDTSASTEIAGITTVTNAGTASKHPIFKVSRSGGTSALLFSLRNETTGKILMFNGYALLDGETLTVDCRPDKQSIVSSFFGERPSAILANSDFGSFTLQPDANSITCLVDHGGAVTVVTWLEYRTPYTGAD